MYVKSLIFDKIIRYIKEIVMNENIIKEISSELKVTTAQVENALKLISEGNTIPFIARYRKELTNALDEEELKIGRASRRERV